MLIPMVPPISNNTPKILAYNDLNNGQGLYTSRNGTMWINRNEPVREIPIMGSYVGYNNPQVTKSNNIGYALDTRGGLYSTNDFINYTKINILSIETTTAGYPPTDDNNFYGGFITSYNNRLVIGANVKMFGTSSRISGIWYSTDQGKNWKLYTKDNNTDGSGGFFALFDNVNNGVNLYDCLVSNSMIMFPGSYFGNGWAYVDKLTDKYNYMRAEFPNSQTEINFYNGFGGVHYENYFISFYSTYINYIYAPNIKIRQTVQPPQRFAHRLPRNKLYNSNIAVNKNGTFITLCYDSNTFKFEICYREGGLGGIFNSDLWNVAIVPFIGVSGNSASNTYASVSDTPSGGFVVSVVSFYYAGNGGSNNFVTFNYLQSNDGILWNEIPIPPPFSNSSLLIPPNKLCKNPFYS
jgi:hypothetical protein